MTTLPTAFESNSDVEDILIVDDETANLKLLSGILVKEGYRVRPANKPQLAIESARSQPPKLILLDVRMPEMDGFEVCRQLKQDDRTRDIPIIFVSALREAEERVAGFEVGGMDFISKPFDELEVLARVRIHVNLRNLQLGMEEQVRERTKQVFESEARFRATFEQAAVGIAHVAPDGQFLRLNEKFCDIVGYDRAELLQLRFQSITYPDDLNTDINQLKLVLDDEIKTYSMEKRYVRKTGDLVWVNLTVSLVRDKAGKPEWFVAVIQDITEHKEDEVQLHTIKKTIDVSSDSAYWVDNAGKFVYVNAAASSGLGYSRDELLQMEIFDVDPALSKEMWPNFWAERRLQDVLHFEATHRRKDGSEFPVELTSVYIECSGKEFIGGFARDITARKQAERTLRTSEQLARTLLNATTDLTFLLDEDGIILDLNDASAEKMGGEREELVGTNMFDKLPPEIAEVRHNILRKAIAVGDDLHFVDRFRPGDVFDTGIYPIGTPAGEKRQVVIFAHDISESEKMLQALQESEAKFRSLVENIPDVIWTTDATGKTTYISENVQESFGFSQEEVYELKNLWLERIHPDDYDQVVQKLTRLFEAGEMFDVEYRILDKDGQWIWLQDRSMSLYQKDGVTYADGLFSNITHRKQANLELQKNRDYLQHLIESIPDAVFSVSLPERTIEWARDTYNVLGHKLDEYIGETTDRLYSSHDDFQALGELLNQAIRDNKDAFIAEALVRRKDCDPIPVEISTTIYRNESKPVSATALVRDISSRTQARKALQDSEARLKEAQRIARIGNWELDLVTNTLTWSDEVFRIFEIDPKHFGATYEAFLDAIHPDDRDMVERAYTQSLKDRRPYGIEHRLLMPGGQIKFVHERCETAYSSEGKPLRSVGTVQDITELKELQSESIRLRLDLAHLNRVMTMNELAAALAHEINQPLGAIVNNASAAKILNSRSAEGKEGLDEILNDIAGDARRAGQIIGKIRGVMKRQDPVFVPLDLNELLDEVLSLYRNSFKLDRFNVVVNRDEGVVLVEGQWIRIQQVLMNLITNAMEAMANSPKKVLTLQTVNTGSMVTVSVCDTGPGISKFDLEHIFDPFYTTKNEGMGIGLRLCKSIIEEHHGRIWAQNNADGGATFSFTLKACSEGPPHELT